MAFNVPTPPELLAASAATHSQADTFVRGRIDTTTPGLDPWAVPPRSGRQPNPAAVAAVERELEDRRERALHEAARDDHEHDWRTR